MIKINSIEEHIAFWIVNVIIVVGTFFAMYYTDRQFNLSNGLLVLAALLASMLIL